jgi:membrane associated rhomboid family serine protease
MFLYIPYGTDAPVYHRPYITVAMIVINVVVFIMFPQREQFEPYMLALGDGLHPLQWLTTNFLHANIGHLISNMLFLWVFGPVVEGKLGALRMLVLYLGIGIGYGAAIQILALIIGVESGFCLGASAIIFGLAAMSFIWAPESKVHGFLFFMFFPHPRCCIARDTEIEIMLMVGFFAVLQVASELLFRNPSGLLHLTGALFGLVAAIVLLRMNYVDCESEDIFSVYSGKKDLAEISRKQSGETEKSKKESKQERQKQQNLLIKGVESALEDKTPLPAFVIFQRLEREFSDWTLPQDLHFKMIQQLLSGKHLEEAMTVMRLYLERYQEQSVFVSVMLAQVFLTQNKPRSAIEVLDDISLEEAKTEQQSAIHKIKAKAEAMFRKNMEEGSYEVGDLI